MTLVKRHARMAPAFGGFFDDFWNRDFADWGLSNYASPTSSLPAVNIMENADNFVVEMAAPGMKKEDFNIELDNDLLTISSEQEMQSEPTNGDKYHRREYSYQAFHRSFHLPNAVDAKKIKAEYNDGVLKIQIPKPESAKKHAPQAIAIK